MRVYVLIVWVFVTTFSCSNRELVVHKGHSDFKFVNGILLYQDRPFFGTMVATYPDGSPQLELHYKAGRKEGMEEQWYWNGAFAQRRMYTKGIKVGTHLGWWDTGLPKFNYHYNGNGAYEGSRKEWYANGQLKLHFNYSNGKESGKQRMWLENGNIRANYEVVGGERFGLIGLKKCYTVSIANYEPN